MGEGVTSFDAGNIIIGGNGSDILEGRGGDDILDGDKWLNVRLSVRTDPADPEHRDPKRQHHEGAPGRRVLR